MSSAFGATNACANYRCESRRAGDFTKTLDVSTTHSCGITLRRWCRITPAFVPDQLSEREQGINLCIAQNPKCDTRNRTILNAHILP